MLQLLHRPEIDALVGWATHVTNYGQSAAASASAANTDTDTNADTATASSQQFSFNPLMGVQPDGPLPHSHLHALIREKANMIVLGSAPGFPPNERKQPWQNVLVESCNTSCLVAMGMVLEEAMTANLLPLAELHVQRCRAMEEQEAKYEEQQEERGVPLPVNYERESFHQWTLPPEEAILNVMRTAQFETQQKLKQRQPESNNVNYPVTPMTDEDKTRTSAMNHCHFTDPDGHNFLPSMHLPSRSIPGVHAQVQQQQQLQTQQQQESDFADQWCWRQEVQNYLPRKNMDLFGWFLASPPSFAKQLLPRRDGGSIFSILKANKQRFLTAQRKLAEKRAKKAGSTAAKKTKVVKAGATAAKYKATIQRKSPPAAATKQVGRPGKRIEKVGSTAAKKTKKAGATSVKSKARIQRKPPATEKQVGCSNGAPSVSQKPQEGSFLVQLSRDLLPSSNSDEDYDDGKDNATDSDCTDENAQKSDQSRTQKSGEKRGPKPRDIRRSVINPISKPDGTVPCVTSTAWQDRHFINKNKQYCRVCMKKASSQNPTNSYAQNRKLCGSSTTGCLGCGPSFFVCKKCWPTWDHKPEEAFLRTSKNNLSR